MRSEPNIAAAAALIADPARAAILLALADGRALPAGELAAFAGLSSSATSAHLKKLLEGGLLALERQGRHRYYRFAGPQVATALSGLALIATQQPNRGVAMRSPEGRALRFARSCYDHLAGELGVKIAYALKDRGLIAPVEEAKCVKVTNSGAAWFNKELGIDVGHLKPGRHGLACKCLDWTERRHHLAGPLGASLFERYCEAGWLTRSRDSRAVQITRKGREGLRAQLGLVFDS
jgi:DNA-binding transcriptional ArsR family regulator